LTIPDWYIKNEIPILKGPSTIIPHEWNIMNAKHPDFPKISLERTEEFEFDERL